MKEVVVLGAGYAGLKAVRTLQKKSGDFHITLVDRNDYHYEATEIHEIAAGSQPTRKITYPIKDVLNEEKVTFIKDTVVTINSDKKSVSLKDSGDISYDYLIVSLGFCSETFGIPGASENALQMVDIDTAENINNHVLMMMDKYRQTKDDNCLKILICGAGFTGIELAGAFTDERKVYADRAGVSPEKIQIICIEAAKKILPMFDEKLADYGLHLIEKLGIKLMLGSMIKEIKKGEVLYATNPDDKELKSITAGTIVWTTGVSGSPVIKESGFSQRRGRVAVSDDLRDPDHDDIYIIGDVSAFMDTASGRPFPTTAQIATKMGKHAAINVLHQLRGEQTEAFSYHSQGTVASVGNTHALGIVGSTSLKGYPASVMKKTIINKSLADIGGLKELLSRGRFDLYH